MRTRGLWGMLLVGLGCATETGTDPTRAAPDTPRTATTSPGFVLSTSAGALATPRDEGVVLRWGAVPDLALPVKSTGLGAVTRSAVDGEGGATLTHANGVEERWVTAPDGAEQSWRFAERPAGGRVAVGVTFAGATLDRAGDDGLWLRAPGGAQLIRYSHATWVDADGVRTAVPARWAGDHVALEVPAEVVARSRFPAVLDPTVTASFALSPQTDGPFTTGVPVPYPELVRVGDSTLVLHALQVPGQAAGVLTVRALDASGVYVPGSLRGIPASAYFYFRLDMRAAWAASYGTGAMVVFPHERGIVAVRLAPDGRPLDAAPIVIRPPQAPATLQNVGGVACTATVCLVVYPEGGSVYAQRVATDGRLLDAAPITLGTTAGTFAERPVVALADRFVVGWSTTLPGATSDIRVSRVATDGRVLDPGGRPVTTAATARRDLVVATDGSRIFLRWYAEASGARPTGVYTQLFDAEMAPLSSLLAHTDLRQPSYAWWDGTGYTVANHQRLARFDAAGARLDATARTVLSSGSTTWLGTIPGGFYMYEAEGVYRYDPLGVRAAGPTRFPLGFRPTSAGDADFEGSNFLASWYHNANAVMARLNASGAALDRPPVEVPSTTLRLARLNGNRAELFNGTDRLSVDLTTRVVSPAESFASAARATVRGGDQRLLLGDGCARRLDAAWRPLDPAPMCFAPARALSGDFDGTNFRFVYSLPEIYTRRMNRDGDAVEFAPVALTSLGPSAQLPVIAFGAGIHMIAWRAGSVIRAVPMAVDGTLGTPVTVTTNSHTETYSGPVLVFDGVNFVVLWSPTRVDVRAQAARVSPAGVLLDATPFNFPNQDRQLTQSTWLAAASDQRGSTLVVYDTFSLDLAADQVRGAFFREDGVVVPDAGVVPLDVPPATDAGAPRVDVPALPDAGAPPTDLGTPPADVPAPTDVVVTPVEVGAGDVGAPADAGVAVDVATGSDVAVSDAAGDLGLVEDVGIARPDASTGRDASVGTDVQVARDVAPASDAGPTSDVSSVADAGSTPPDEDGGCSVDAGRSGGAPSWLGASAALLLVGVRHRRRSSRSVS